MTSARSVIYNVLFTAKEYCCLCYSKVENDFIRIHDEVFLPEIQNMQTIKFQEVIDYILGNETADLMLPSDTVCKQCTQSCIQSYIFIKRCKKNIKTMPDIIQKFLSNVDSFELGCYKSVVFAVDVNVGVTNVCCKRIIQKETLLKKLEHGIMKHKDNGLYLSDEESSESDVEEIPATEAKDKEMESENGSGASEKPAEEKANADNDEPKIHIKKPLNAFMLYLKEMRPKLVEEFGCNESSSLFCQILGSRWRLLSPEEQAKYNERARLERELHKQKYPHWNSKQRKKRKTRSVSASKESWKKCRAVYGFDQQNLWCRSCRRKKRCIRYKEASSAASCEMPLPMVTPKSEKEEEISDASSVEDTDLPQDYLRWFINDL